MSRLGKIVGSPVYTAVDAAYRTECSGFNTAHEHTPGVVVAVTKAADIVETVRFARENALKITVQSTGHGAETPIRSDILVSTKALRAHHVDGEKKTAHVSAATPWQGVITDGARHGLAPITGSSGTVGAIGFLVGGGLGPLSRSHGFGSDYVTAMKVVTGAGEHLDVDAKTNPDLFWALRGGAKGLGIVTDAHVRLVDMPSLYGGALVFDEKDIEGALRGWIDWTKGAHPRLTTSIVIAMFPDLPFVAPPLRGRRVLALRVAFPGPREDAIAATKALRSIAPIYADWVRDLDPAEIGLIHRDPTEPAPSWVGGMMFDDVDQDFATKVLAHQGAGTNGPFVAIELRHLGEATTRDVPEGSAVAGRDAGFALGMIAVDPARFAELPALSGAIREEFTPWRTTYTNPNFVGTTRGLVCFPPDVSDKLAEIRRRFDPDGVFAPGEP